MHIENISTNFDFYPNFSVVLKLLPCVMLSFVSIRLVYSLFKTKQRTKRILTRTASGRNRRIRTRSSRMVYLTGRMTKMLLTLLILFLITEFPQGVLGLMSALLGQRFFKKCYMPVSDIMDFFALLTSTVNFFLYCGMSKKFRQGFYKIFQCAGKCKIRKSKEVAV